MTRYKGDKPSDKPKNCMTIPAIYIVIYDQEYFIAGPGIAEGMKWYVRSTTRFAAATIKIAGIAMFIAGHIEQLILLV